MAHALTQRELAECHEALGDLEMFSAKYYAYSQLASDEPVKELCLQLADRSREMMKEVMGCLSATPGGLAKADPKVIH